MQNQLCLYCGQAGHMRNTCPVRPSSDQRSVSDNTRAFSSVSSITLPVEIIVQNQTIQTTALDSGAAGNFIDSEFVGQLHLELTPCNSSLARRPSPGQGKDSPSHRVSHPTHRNPAFRENPILRHLITYPSADSWTPLASNTRPTDILERRADH